jgi:hypothetical protein
MPLYRELFQFPNGLVIKQAYILFNEVLHSERIASALTRMLLHSDRADIIGEIISARYVGRKGKKKEEREREREREPRNQFKKARIILYGELKRLLITSPRNELQKST